MQRRSLRILHVVGGMNRGGVETWLIQVLRNIDRTQFRMDFLVHTDKPCAYDEEVRDLGSMILPCLHPSSPLQYRRNFVRILNAYGPFDVVHSHVHHFSGYVLSLAHRANVRIRIAHSHNDTTAAEAKAQLLRQMYLNVTARWVRSFATVGLACSEVAAFSLFGAEWARDLRWRLLYYGIDLAPFRQPKNRAAVRAELGIAPDAFVVGHIGRFHEQKNHAFLLDIAASVIRRASSTRFLLVGDGPLRSEMEAKARSLQIEKNVIFVGLRADIPRLMLGAMDAFLFPSLHEGLPLVLLEAQAAGLPYLISDVITPEVDLVPTLGQRLNLLQPATEWADTVFKCQENQRREPQADTLSLLEKSAFNIHSSIEKLARVYSGEDALLRAA